MKTKTMQDTIKEISKDISDKAYILRSQNKELLITYRNKENEFISVKIGDYFNEYKFYMLVYSKTFNDIFKTIDEEYFLYEKMIGNENELTIKSGKSAFSLYDIRFSQLDQNASNSIKQAQKQAKELHINFEYSDKTIDNSKTIEDTEKMKTIEKQESKTINKAQEFKKLTIDEKIAQDRLKLEKLNGLIIELIGTWLWVSGNTKENKEELKAMRFKWSHNRIAWYKAYYS